MQSAPDSAVDVDRLQQENAQLRGQLETQYKHMLQMVETIQKVHLARITEAARDTTTEHSKGEANGMSAASFLVCPPVSESAPPCYLPICWRQTPLMPRARLT